MTTTPAEMNKTPREEWRDLGFFYDYDESNSCWRLVGSRHGLLRFADLIDSYAADSRNEQLSEHEHYGPYMYLKLMTWNEREITDHAICGTLADFRTLSLIVGNKLSSSRAGGVFSIEMNMPPKPRASSNLTFAKMVLILRARIRSYRTTANNSLDRSGGSN